MQTAAYWRSRNICALQYTEVWVYNICIMEKILQQYNVLHCENILRDDFDTNLLGWEITKEDE